MSLITKRIFVYESNKNPNEIKIASVNFDSAYKHYIHENSFKRRDRRFLVQNWCKPFGKKVVTKTQTSMAKELLSCQQSFTDDKQSKAINKI